MALYTSSLTAIYTYIPAKISKSNNLIRRTTCVIVHHSSSTIPSFRSSFPKPIFAIPLSDPLRATAPQKYVYPDPNPQFAEAEIQKFKDELRKKLAKDEEFGEALDNVVNVCAEIFSEFLHKEYGGPGTLMVDPFTDILVALKERKLPGAPLAARTSLLWAQNNVDQDWQLWNSKLPE